jgi:tetratricopeptide (TPR) repeat protein
MLTRTRETDRSYARAKVLYGAGFLSWKQANAGAGARYAEEALSIFRERGDRFWGSQAQWVLAVSRMAQGYLEQGRLLLEECLSGFKEVKSTWGEANALAFLGLNSEIQGNLAEALSYAQKSLELFHRIHDVVHSSVMLGILAATRASLGDKEGTRRDFEELQRLPSQTSNRWALGMFLQSAAYNVQYNYQRYEAAKILYQASLVHWREIQRLESGFSIVRGLMGLAELAAIQGHGQRSGWLFGAADHLTPSSGSYREALNERVARSHKQLDAATAATFKAGWTEGLAATLEQAIDRALQEATPET